MTRSQTILSLLLVSSKLEGVANALKSGVELNEFLRDELTSVFDVVTELLTEGIEEKGGDNQT